MIDLRAVESRTLIPENENFLCCRPGTYPSIKIINIPNDLMRTLFAKLNSLAFIEHHADGKNMEEQAWKKYRLLPVILFASDVSIQPQNESIIKDRIQNLRNDK